MFSAQSELQEAPCPSTFSTEFPHIMSKWAAMHSSQRRLWPQYRGFFVNERAGCTWACDIRQVFRGDGLPSSPPESWCCVCCWTTFLPPPSPLYPPSVTAPLPTTLSISGTFSQVNTTQSPTVVPSSPPLVISVSLLPLHTPLSTLHAVSAMQHALQTVTAGWGLGLQRGALCTHTPSWSNKHLLQQQ